MNAQLVICKRYCDTILECATLVSSPNFAGKKIVVFCEDKYTLSVEGAIAAALKNKGSFDIVVTTFSRFLQRTKFNASPLSKEAAVMAVTKIILDSQNSLKYIRAALAKSAAPLLYELIAQLKSSKITPSDLKSYSGSDQILQNKLSDIYLIYTKYQEFLDTGFIDENGYLSLVANAIENNSALNNTTALFVGFSSFTRQGAAVIESALSAFQNVVGIFCGGEGDVYTNQAQNSFLRVCTEKGITPQLLSAQNIAQTQSAICQNLFEPKVFKNFTKVQTDSVFLYQAATVKEEAAHVCERIEFEIKHNNLRYKDISVVCLDEHLDTIEQTFKLHNIPYFSDSKKGLIEHPLATLVLSYIKMFENGFLFADTVKFFKNPYFELDRTLTCELENYMLANGFVYDVVNKPLYAPHEYLQEFSAIFSRIKELPPLKKNMTAADFCKQLTNLFEMLGIDKTTQILSEKFAKFNSLVQFNAQIKENLLQIFSEIEKVLAQTQLTISDLYQIVYGGINAKSISLITAYADAVYIGNYSFAGINPSVLFCMNLTQAIPTSGSDTAFISDRDILKLYDFSVKIEPRIQTVNERARECAGIICASFKDRLNLSYHVSDGQKQVRKSDIITYIQKILTYKDAPLNAINYQFLQNVDEQSATLYHAFRYATTKQGLQNFLTDVSEFKSGFRQSIAAANAFYHAAPLQIKQQLKNYLDNLDTQILQKITTGNQLFFSRSSISASLIQSFYDCPMRNFLQNALRLTPRQTAEIKPVDNGNFLHSVFENLPLGELDVLDDFQIEALCRNLLDSAVDNSPAKFFKAAPKTRVWLDFLVKEAVRIAKATQTHNRQSSFKNIGKEVAFGKNAALPPLLIDQENNLYMHGVIDRIDQVNNAIRIIDYKSGRVDRADIGENYFLGRKIQLWVYLNAARENREVAGAYYFDLNDKLAIDAPSINSYKMTGVTVNLPSIISATDNLLQNKQSSILANIRKKANGDISGDVLSIDEFDDYLGYCKEIAKLGAKYLRQGIICPSPAVNACNYCQYIGICGKDGQVVERSLGKITAAAVASAKRAHSQGKLFTFDAPQDEFDTEDNNE